MRFLSFIAVGFFVLTIGLAQTAWPQDEGPGGLKEPPPPPKPPPAAEVAPLAADTATPAWAEGLKSSATQESQPPPTPPADQPPAPAEASAPAPSSAPESSATGAPTAAPDEDVGPPWVNQPGIPGQEDTRGWHFTPVLSGLVGPEVRDNMDDFNNARADFRLSFASRLRAGVDARYQNVVGAKVVFQDSRIWGDDVSAGASNRWLLDLGQGWGTTIHEGFIEVYHPAEWPLVFRIGRQELAYGNELLIGTDDWSFLGRAFDALLLRWDLPKLTLDIFYSRIREQELVVHAEGPCSRGGKRAGCMVAGDDLAGFDLAIRYFPPVNLAVFTYYLRASPTETMLNFTNEEIRSATSGFRISDDGSRPEIYNAELAFQYGNVWGESQSAVAVLLQGGYRFPAAMKPWLKIHYSFASGDDKPAGEDDNFGMFLQYFPSNHYLFGVMDLVGWSNSHDIALHGGFWPDQTVSLEAAVHIFMLAKIRSPWVDSYGKIVALGTMSAPGYAGEYDAGGNSGQFLGVEPDLVMRWLPVGHFEVDLEYGVFFPGGFPKAIAAEKSNQDRSGRKVLGSDPAQRLIVSTILYY